MNPISRFLGLSREKRTLLVQATILLAATRLGLALLSFATLRRMLAGLAAPAAVRTSENEPGAAGRPVAIWAVETVSRHFPAVGTCLTQALAAHVLLGRTGHKSDLRIGVTRNADGKFVAHAWLENGGIVLIGGTCHTSYTPMPVLDGLDPRVSDPRLRS